MRQLRSVVQATQENKERIQKMKQEILLIQAEEKEEHRDETRLIRDTQVEYYLEDKKEDPKIRHNKFLLSLYSDMAVSCT